MNIFWRICAGISLGAFLLTTGWGGAPRSWSEVWDQPALTLRLSEESQPTGKIKLAGARNEHVFFSVLLAGGSSSLKVRLAGAPHGFEWNVFRVAAVPPDSAGKFPPDALLPLGEDWPAWGTGPQTLWISLKIPYGCLPGHHHLALVISDQGGSAQLPVDLRVFRFALPDDLPIAIFGGFWRQPQQWSRYAKDNPSQEVRIIKSYYQNLRKYKFNAIGGSYPLPLEQIHPGQRIEDFSPYHELLRHGLDDLQFRNFQIPSLKNWESVSSPDSAFSRRAQVFYPLYSEYLKRHGWEQRALNYLVDEPRSQQHGAVVQAFALAKSLAPKIRTLSAGWGAPPEFAKVINIWAYQASRYQEEDQDRGARQGQEAWLYANRLHGIDHPLSHQRLIGWLLHRYQFSGYLLWGVNYWPHDPWTNPPGPRDFFRRGTFYYPHPQTGLPIATTRLEALRRGFQDYQYLLLFDQAGGRGLIPKEQQDLVLTRVQRFTDNLPRSSFPVSMGELEILRLQIGELLDRLEGT